MLIEVCYSNINNIFIFNSLTEISCASSYLKKFDSCLSTPLATDTTGYFYYIYFIKLLSIKKNIETNLKKLWYSIKFFIWNKFSFKTERII